MGRWLGRLSAITAGLLLRQWRLLRAIKMNDINLQDLEVAIKAIRKVTGIGPNVIISKGQRWEFRNGKWELISDSGEMEWLKRNKGYIINNA